MIENDKKVSIVIPTFNRAHYLENTIDACLKQTYPCEIIVCDHGSKDNTPEIAKKYGNKITYIRREEDFGPHFCWLDGILHAKNEFIHLQFDDDWIKPAYIAECIKLFDKEIGFVFTAAELYDERKNEIQSVLFSNLFPTGTYRINKIKSYLLRYLVSPGAIILRKKDMIDALYQGNLPIARNSYHGVGPDYFMTLICLLRYKKFGYVSSPLAVFRSHENSITINAQEDEQKQKRFYQAYDEVRDYYYLLEHSKNCLIYKIAKNFTLPKIWINLLPGFLKRFLKRHFFK